MTGPSRQDIVLLEFQNETHLEMYAFEAAFRASKIIGEILGTMYGNEPASLDDASSFLRRLTEWRVSLPEHLIQPTDSSNEGSMLPSKRALRLASMNIACFYYYAVILVSRPFLIASFHSREGRTDDANQDPGQQTSATVAQLAEICVDAAIYMIETVCDMSKAKLLMKNTCFTK